MTSIENLLNSRTPRPNHGLFFIKSGNINSTILSLIFSINIIRNGSDDSKKILIMDTCGTHSKNNKRISFLNNDLLPVISQIRSQDKYSFSNTDYNQEYWENIGKKYPNENTIIITDLSVIFLDRAKNYTEEEKKEAFKNKLNKLRLFAEQNNKHIVILESKIEKYPHISSFVFKKNVYSFSCSASEMHMKDFNGNTFFLRLPIWEKTEDKKTLNIQDKISNISRISFDNVAKSKLRTLPVCKTGFESLDIELEGGLELGQVVSLVSSDNDILTQFSLQMATQLSNFYNPLYVCLSMNLRRLKDMLSHKNNIQQNSPQQNSNQEEIHLLTNEKFTIDGDLTEVIDAIEYFHNNEDTRVIFIDSDDMLQITDKSFSDSKREVDEIYKRLQFLSNKLDIIIIVQSELTFDMTKKLQSKDEKNSIEIDNSIKAVKYTKTQILLEQNTMRITKKMKKIGGTTEYTPLITTTPQNKELGNFVDVTVE